MLRTGRKDGSVYICTMCQAQEPQRQAFVGAQTTDKESMPSYRRAGRGHRDKVPVQRRELVDHSFLDRQLGRVEGRDRARYPVALALLAVRIRRHLPVNVAAEDREAAAAGADQLCLATGCVGVASAAARHARRVGLVGSTDRLIAQHVPLAGSLGMISPPGGTPSAPGLSPTRQPSTWSKARFSMNSTTMWSILSWCGGGLASGSTSPKRRSASSAGSVCSSRFRAANSSGENMWWRVRGFASSLFTGLDAAVSSARVAAAAKRNLTSATIVMVPCAVVVSVGAAAAGSLGQSVVGAGAPRRAAARAGRAGISRGSERWVTE